MLLAVRFSQVHFFVVHTTGTFLSARLAPSFSLLRLGRAILRRPLTLPPRFPPPLPILIAVLQAF